MTIALGFIVLVVLGFVKLLELLVDVTERVDNWRLARRYKRNIRLPIEVPWAVVVGSARKPRDMRICRSLDQVNEPIRFMPRGDQS